MMIEDGHDHDLPGMFFLTANSSSSPILPQTAILARSTLQRHVLIHYCFSEYENRVIRREHWGREEMFSSFILPGVNGVRRTTLHWTPSLYAGSPSLAANTILPYASIPYRNIIIVLLHNKL